MEGLLIHDLNLAPTAVSGEEKDPSTEEDLPCALP